MKSGEGGTESPAFSQVLIWVALLAKALFAKLFAAFRPLPVISGYLALVGVILSTVSAQSDEQHGLPQNFAIVPNCPVASKARRRKAVAADNVAASYSRYSSDLQDDSSISQQQRVCRERAETNKHELLAELEFADEAISGTKRDRDGLTAMLAAAKEGRFRVLYFYCLSRLARELLISLPILKELVYVHGIRVISITDGIDSANSNWEFMAIVRCWMHQEFIKALRAAVLRGQEEAILNGFALNDTCYGYGTEAIPGTEAGRRGRHPRPRKRYVILMGLARWVRQIFHWFVHEGRSIGWIVRELNRLKVPKGNRATTSSWRRDLVIRILRNLKYIGIWPWGERTNVRDPSTGKLWQEDRPAAEVAKYRRLLPDLRLIDDETFFKAQALLDEQEEKYGKHREADGCFTGSPSDASRPRHLLQGLIHCGAERPGSPSGTCGSIYQVCGGKVTCMACKANLRGECSNSTRLPRDLAQKMIVEAVSKRLLRNPAWRQAALEELEQSWAQRQKNRPNERDEVGRALSSEILKRDRLLDLVEKGCPPLSVDERLQERMKSISELQRRLDRLDREAAAELPPPTPEWLDVQLQDVHALLQRDIPAAALKLRALIKSIVVKPVPEPGRKRKFLRGTFQLKLSAVVAALERTTDASQSAFEEKTEEVVIDFNVKGPPPWAAIAEDVRQLFEQGVTFRDMATKLNCKRSWPAKAWTWWHQQRGLPVPSGHKCRARLQRKFAIRYADRVVELIRQGMQLQDIAQMLGIDRNVVTAAKRYWFESRGLPVPDGRTLRYKGGDSLPKDPPLPE